MKILLLALLLSVQPKPKRGIVAKANFALPKIEVSQEYKNELRQLFKITGIDQSFSITITDAIKNYKKQKKNVPESFWTSLEKELNLHASENAINLFAPAYQQHLTIEDLKKIIEFYESTSGKKYAISSPKIMEETILLGQSWAMDIHNEIQNLLIDKGFENKMKQDF